uniref:Uncharacterized protein n=1 Tax=Arundo donax TaxID=35708 RepID=A0A0A9FRE6_ARUDO
MIINDGTAKLLRHKQPF